MELIVKPMRHEEAAQIAEWVYAAPYDLYSMDGSQEDISELLNGEYAAAVDRNGDVKGFFCTGNSARVSGGYGAGVYDDESFIDFGLGMKPELTGEGRGLAFVHEGMNYVSSKFPGKGIRLVVASFNQRATRVYEHAGFESKCTFKSLVGGQSVEFICMTRPCKEI